TRAQARRHSAAGERKYPSATRAATSARQFARPRSQPRTRAATTRRRIEYRRPTHVGLRRSSGAGDLLEMARLVEIGAEPLCEAHEHRIEALNETDGVGLGMIG